MVTPVRGEDTLKSGEVLLAHSFCQHFFYLLQRFVGRLLLGMEPASPV